jgi:hypothetical protein
MARLARLALGIGLVLSLGPLDPAPASARDEDGEARRRALAKALGWLEERTLRLPDAEGTPRKPFDVAAAGYVHLLAGRERGRRAFVERCRASTLDYVAHVERRSRVPSELPSRHGLATSEALIQYTWPLAMAAILLAECHEQGLDASGAKRALQRIATLLGEAQGENGGWGHGRIAPRDGGGAPAPSPLAGFPEVGGGYPSTLLASSALVATALGRSRSAVPGLAGPDAGAARRYFEDAQLPNGNLPYDPSQRSADGDRTGAARAAGALVALWSLGVPLSDRTLARAADYLDAHEGDVSEGHGSATLGLLYGALAARVRGDRTWRAFRERFFPRILAAQSEEGAFACIAEGTLFGTTNDSRPFGGPLGGPFQEGVDVYVTALHAWILLLDDAPPRPPEAPAPGAPPPAPVTPR